MSFDNMVDGERFEWRVNVQTTPSITLHWQSWECHIMVISIKFDILDNNNNNYQSGVDFISEIGRRLEQASGDARERCCLFQRFNSVTFRGNFFLDTR